MNTIDDVRNLEAVFLVRTIRRLWLGTDTLQRILRYAKYSMIAARATRQSLKEADRAAAEKYSYQVLKYQSWKDGQPSESVRLFVFTDIG